MTADALRVSDGVHLLRPVCSMRVVEEGVEDRIDHTGRRRGPVDRRSRRSGSRCSPPQSLRHRTARRPLKPCTKTIGNACSWFSAAGSWATTGQSSRWLLDGQRGRHSSGRGRHAESSPSRPPARGRRAKLRDNLNLASTSTYLP